MHIIPAKHTHTHTNLGIFKSTKGKCLVDFSASFQSWDQKPKGTFLSRSCLRAQLMNLQMAANLTGWQGGTQLPPVALCLLKCPMWLLFSLAVGIDITLHEQGGSYGSCVHPVHLCHTGDEKCALYTLHTYTHTRAPHVKNQKDFTHQWPLRMSQISWATNSYPHV